MIYLSAVWLRFKYNLINNDHSIYQTGESRIINTLDMV